MGPSIEGDRSILSSEHSNRRKVRVFQADINHMQCTPMFRKEDWTMQYETIGNFRSNSMLWGRATDDPYQRWSDKGEIVTMTISDCVGWAVNNGI